MPPAKAVAAARDGGGAEDGVRSLSSGQARQSTRFQELIKFEALKNFNAKVEEARYLALGRHSSALSS